MGKKKKKRHELRAVIQRITTKKGKKTKIKDIAVSGSYNEPVDDWWFRTAINDLKNAVIAEFEVRLVKDYELPLLKYLCMERDVAMKKRHSHKKWYDVTVVTSEKTAQEIDEEFCRLARNKDCVKALAEFLSGKPTLSGLLQPMLLKMGVFNHEYFRKNGVSLIWDRGAATPRGKEGLMLYFEDGITEELEVEWSGYGTIYKNTSLKFWKKLRKVLNEIPELQDEEEKADE